MRPGGRDGHFTEKSESSSLRVGDQPRQKCRRHVSGIATSRPEHVTGRPVERGPHNRCKQPQQSDGEQRHSQHCGCAEDSDPYAQAAAETDAPPRQTQAARRKLNQTDESELRPLVRYDVHMILVENVIDSLTQFAIPFIWILPAWGWPSRANHTQGFQLKIRGRFAEISRMEGHHSRRDRLFCNSSGNLTAHVLR
jgi:hypothetical protein